MHYFKGIAITEIKTAITKKKQIFSAEWLGKSLAYTPYQPRPLNLKRTDSPHTLWTIPSNCAEFLQFANSHKDCAAFILESLEISTYIRRYVNVPLVYDFLILDSYQLLEALVYGIDCVMLYPSFLKQKELQELSNYALKLGLERIFCIENKEDLTKAILAKADILNLCGHDTLIPLIPKQKILLSENFEPNAKNLEALDAKILQ